LQKAKKPQKKEIFSSPETNKNIFRERGGKAGEKNSETRKKKKISY